MKAHATLQAKRINYGRSEIWVEAESKELTPTRTIATNEVDNVTRRHCPNEIFDVFYAQYHVALRHIAPLSMPELDAIAGELGLKI